MKRQKSESSEDEEDDDAEDKNEVDPKTAILETTTIDLINSKSPGEKLDL